MKSLSYHGGGASGNRFSASSTSTVKVYASLECDSGYSFAGLTTGSNGYLRGAGGTFSVYTNTNVGYSGAPVGQFQIQQAGVYQIIGGGTVRVNNSNWIVRMGFRVNAGTIHATKISGSAANNYSFTNECIMQTLAVGDTISLAYAVDYVGGASTIDFEEGFLTLFKVS